MSDERGYLRPQTLNFKGFSDALNDLKQISKESAEYWYGRDLLQHLGYTKWENFVEVIRKAEMACESTGLDSGNHFLSLRKKVRIGSGAMAEREDYILSRYACYLTAMNGLSSKPEIGFAQSYFAVQTRRQEIADREDGLEKRLSLRGRVRSAVKALNAAASKVGVQNYALFHDAGYRGLYEDSLTDIKKRKGLDKKDDLFDRAGRAELAANEFRITQTEEVLRSENIRGQKSASDAHFTVGQKVRDAIRRIGGTMPEDLPPEESIKQIERQRKNHPKRLGN